MVFSLSEERVTKAQSFVDREAKKARFKDGKGDEDVDMLVDLE